MGNANSQAEGAAAAIAELVEEVFPTDPVWRDMEGLVRKRMSHARHYRYKMRITRLFRILPSDIVKSYEQEARRQSLGKPTRLFHGTTPSNAESILLSGFSIPSRPGMFGRGIYFAKDPLKSVKYAHQGTRSPAISRKSLSPTDRSESGNSPLDRVSSATSSWFSGLWQSTFGTEPEDNVRLMLACEVYLGKSRTMRSAKPSFEPSKGLKRAWPLSALGAKGYNSVRAPGGKLGCVKVTEFVIYEEHQAIPKFLIEFEQVQAS